MSLLTQEYSDVMRDVGSLLDGNSEWIQRYKKYISAIKTKSSIIKDARSKFESSKNLDIYLPMSKVVKANSRTEFFDVRYKGQSVGEIFVKNSGVSIRFQTSNNKYYPEYPAILFDIAKNDNKDWHSEEACCFRKYFARSPRRENGKNLEHDFESQLLKQFLKHTSDDKYLWNIQPIRLLEKGYFQIPTPIKASRVKDGKIGYSKHYGGGVDILARQGIGKGVCLTVIELKDECLESEPPEKAIMQAIAYATFLQKLLRTPEAAPEGWWSFFGFNGSIPARLKIRTVIAMPKGTYNDTSFAREELYIPNSRDCLELHYVYFNVDNDIITEIADTSLNC